MAKTNPFLQSPFQALIDKQSEPVLPPAFDPVNEVKMPDIEAAPVEAPQPIAPAPKAKAKPASLIPPQELREVFAVSAEHFGVPENLLMAIAQQESSYDPQAMNAESGAGGIVQYMDATAKSLGINRHDPNEAVPAAAMQIKERLDKGMSLEDAVMEHFAGPDRKKWGPKTAAYGKQVLEKAEAIGRELYGDLPDEAPQQIAAPVDQTPLPNFGVTPEALQRIQAQWNAATPDERVQMESLRGPRGYIAKELNKRHPAKQAAPNPLGLSVDPVTQVNDAYKNPTLDSIDPRAEARARNLVNQGMNGDTANKVARAAALAGMAPGTEPGIGQRIENTQFDFETRRKFNEDPFFSNPAVRGAVKGYEGYKRGILGLNQMASEVLGAQNVANSLAEANAESRQQEAAMGQANSYGQRMFEGAASSIAQQIPALIGGAVTGSEALVLGTMFAQTLGNEYSEGRARGQNEEQALGRAALYGTFEVVGEKLGLGDTLKGLRGAVNGATTQDVATKMARALLKEIPGEQLTTLGQFGVDQLGGGYGLNTEAGLAEYLQQAADTAVQTVLQGGMMAGGASTVAQVGQMAGNRPQPQQMPQERIEPSMQPEAQDLQPAAPSIQPTPPAGPLESAVRAAAPQEESDAWTSQVMGDDGQIYTIDSASGVVTPAEPEATAGPLESAVQAAATLHAADPAPTPILPEAEPAAPDYTAMPLEDLQARLKEIAQAAKADINERKRLMPERKAVEQEINARLKAAKEESKPAEEPLTSGPFEDIKQANRMMLRHVEKTGVPHEVVEDGGKFRIKPLEASDGLDTAGASRGTDGRGRSSADADVVGMPDGAGRAGTGDVPGGEHAGATGERGDHTAINRTAANGSADNEQALSYWEKNPYHARQFAREELVNAFMDKHGVDRTKFEPVQIGPNGWKIQPRAAQESTVKEVTADVPQRQEVPEEAQVASGAESAESPAASDRTESVDAAAGTSVAQAAPAVISREKSKPKAAGEENGRRYHIVAINEKTGVKEYMTRVNEPLTHAEAVTMKSKISDYPGRRVQLEQVASPAATVAEKPKRKVNASVARRQEANARQEEAVRKATKSLAARSAAKEQAATAEPQPMAAEQPSAPIRHKAAKPKRKAAPQKDELVKSAAEWAEEMTALRRVKPRAIERVYGANPTDEQRAAHNAAEKEWNRKYRHASKMQKEALERDNAAFRARQQASKVEAAAQEAQQEDLEAEEVRYSVSGDRTYPIAPRDEWYGEGTFQENGGRMVLVSPDEYIANVRPLTMDEESRENIDLLKEHIEAGGTLDPLLIRANGKEDGRHRAYAAKELGIAQVPVIAYGEHFKDAPSAESQGVRYSANNDTDYSLMDLPMAQDVMPAVDAFVQALANAGIVKLHASASTLPVKGKAPQGTQALTTANGEIHLVASNLNNNAKGVVLHEAFHAGVKSLIGSAQWKQLMQRLNALYNQGKNTGGAANAFWKQAERRVKVAQLKGAVAPGMEAEEFGAYAIEEYAQAPLTVRKWVDDLIGAVKAWALRRFGAQLGQITPAQLSALAKMALLDVQASRTQPAFSAEGEPDQERLEFENEVRKREVALGAVQRDLPTLSDKELADYGRELKIRLMEQSSEPKGKVAAALRAIAKNEGRRPKSLAEYAQDLEQRVGISVAEDGAVEVYRLDDRTRKAVGDLPVVLYHHTSSALLESIRASGLIVGEKTNEGSTSAGVYLTTDYNTAAVDIYSRVAAQKYGGNPIVLRVLRRVSELRQDPDDIDVHSVRGTQFVSEAVPPKDINLDEFESHFSVDRRAQDGELMEDGHSVVEKGTRYSVAGSPPIPMQDEAEQVDTRSLTPEEHGIFRKLQANVQDSQNRIKQVQERIRKAFGVQDLGGADHYLAETNRPGRIAARKEDARDKLFEPLMKDLAKAGYTGKQLSELLHAQHAVERNKIVAEINPEFPDGGSGMKNQRAGEILKQYEGETKLLQLADRARSIARMTLDMKLAYGLVTQDDYDALVDRYESYVPLKGDGEFGFRIKRAMGHDEREEHILENIARDYEQAVVAGEKNLARQSLLRMILSFKDDDLWTARVPPKGRRVVHQGHKWVVTHNGMTLGEFDSEVEANRQSELWATLGGDHFMNYEVTRESAGQKVKEFVLPLQDNEILVYVKGDPVRIQIYDETLARQLRPLKGEQMNVVLEFMRKHNRWLSMVFTGYNPAFIVKNATRDAITGSINMTGNHGAATAVKAWARYPMAWATMLQWAATKKVPDTDMGRMLSEYRAQGGKVGASYMSDLEEQGKSLQRMFDDAKGVKGYAAEGRVLKASAVAARKTIMGLAHAVEVLNQAFENALRLALFAQLRAEGQKPGKAAAAAKAVTVNFDRKGAMTNQMGAFYLFINPAIQGTANATMTMVKGEHKYQAWALTGMMAGAGFAMAAMGMDDDKDRWLGEKWDTRTKNLRLRVGETTINIPMSQEFAPFYALGVAMGEVSRGESPMRATTNILSSFLDAYYPMQGAVQPGSDNPSMDLLLAHIPTVGKMPAQVAANRNSFGGKVVPETENTRNRPDNLKMNRGTKGSVYDAAAQALAVGKPYENDLSKVSPETLRLVWGTYTGGLGRFIADSVGAGHLASQANLDMDAGDVPILKDFVKPDSVNPIRSRFYDLSNEARKTIDEFTAAKKALDREAMKEIAARPNAKTHLGLAKMVKSVNEVQALYADRAVAINADKSLNAADKRAQLKALEAEQEAIYRKAIQAFTD